MSGVEFFARDDEHWYPLGRHLPEFGIPRDLDDNSIPLASALVPAPIDVPASKRVLPRPAPLCLIRDEDVRPPSACRCRLKTLLAWATTVPPSRLKATRAAIAGDLVMMLGSPLPAIPDGTRYWGATVLVPLGFRTDPGLSEPAIRRALGVSATDIVLLTLDGYEVIASTVFKPLTLGGLRLAERSRLS